MRLSATVINCKGNDSEQDDFYFNGNFSNNYATQSIQCSFEKAANNYVFAISDSMGMEDNDFNGISAIREIKKYHESAKLHQFSLETISEKIYEAVQLSSNLIYSKSVIASQSSSRLTGFSSLIIDNNRAAIMNLGNNGAFLFRQGEQKDIFSRNNGRKSEKLKSLGITPPAPDIYNDTEKILRLAEEESKTKIKLSPSFELEEDDIIVLCSDGLLNGITRSRLEAIVNSGLEPSKIASVLYQEALKVGVDDGITVMVIQVEEIRSLAFGYGNRKSNYTDFENEQENEEDEEKRSENNIVTYILGFICVLVISGVLFMGYLIFTNSGIWASNKDKNIAQQSNATSSISDSTSSGVRNDTASDASSSSTGTSQNDNQGSSNDNSQEDGSADQNSPQKDTSPENQQQGGSGNQGGTNSETDSNQNPNDEYDIYVVKSGDTFSSISNKYYGDPNKYSVIMKYNNIKLDNSLKEGQELKIPKIK